MVRPIRARPQERVLEALIIFEPLVDLGLRCEEPLKLEVLFFQLQAHSRKLGLCSLGLARKAVEFVVEVLQSLLVQVLLLDDFAREGFERLLLLRLCG